MLRLFKIKKEKKEKQNAVAEKAAGTLAKAILKVQTMWATWLSAREQKMTLQQKKKALYAYCIIMAVLTASFLYRAFTYKHEQSNDWLKPPSITLPEDSRLPDSLNLEYLRELYKKRKQQSSDSLTIK